MVTSTDDVILRQDMPSALTKVESAAKLLEEAAKMSMVKKPFRVAARVPVIWGFENFESVHLQKSQVLDIVMIKVSKYCGLEKL